MVVLDNVIGKTKLFCTRMKTGIASKFLISHVIGKSFSIDGTNPLQCTLLEASNDMLTLKIFSHRNSERMVATLGIKVAGQFQLSAFNFSFIMDTT